MATDTPQGIFRGHCACGAVTWKSTQNSDHLDACYCRQCQQISGSPVVYWVGVPKNASTLTGPVETLRLSELATRGFCKGCGGTLYMQYDFNPEKIYFAAATTVQNDFGMPKVTAHIFVRSKPDWFAIGEDGVPRWPDWEDDFTLQFPDIVARWRRDEASSQT